jgi:hypothetical protein
VDSLAHVGEFPDASSSVSGVLAPTFFAEGASHVALRTRIADFSIRACATKHAVSVEAGDVFLFQTGITGITRLHEAIVPLRADLPVVVFGACLLEHTSAVRGERGRH